jgi:hypothetical protein
VRALGEVQGLEEVALFGNRVTDYGASQLYRMKHLKMVGLSNNHLSQRGKMQTRKRFDKCIVNV